MTVTLSPDQQRAREFILERVKAGAQCTVIHGLAGTGKTTLLASLANIDGACMCAPTGKAASVLRGKTGQPASTLHRLLYRPQERTNHVCREPGGKDCKCRPHLEWLPVNEPGELAGTVALLDECSMVGDGIASDLLRAGCKIIAFGDPGQLPPVKAEPYFVKPDYTLTEIHRQAAESPIIRQAYNVRSGNMYQDDGEGFRVVTVDCPDLIWADMVLCWRNSTRIEINRYMREARGVSGWPKKGEPLVCLKNSYRHGIMNGETFTVAEDYCGTGALSLAELKEAIPFPHIESVSQDKPGFMSNRFDFAYCLTVHKSQGSEWPRVLVVDENNSQDRRSWLYTAITRASEAVRISRI